MTLALARHAAASVCAVFDLDETLIRSKSMIEVFEQYHRDAAASPAEADRRVRELRDTLTSFVERNRDRTAQNRYFYRQLAGIRVADMARAAAQWFARSRSELYHEFIVARLKAHQQAGAVTVVVSGSFAEAIAPVAADLGIDHVVCAQLEQRDGCYTGAMSGEPTIGEGKAIALQHFLDTHGLSMYGGFAYGDHDSDIPLLSLADHPVAVGNNAALLEHASRQRWHITPAPSRGEPMDNPKFVEDFAALLEVAPERITDDFNMAQDAVWDSLAFLSTIALIDTHFNKVVDPMALQSLATFAELRALVQGVEA